MPGTVAAHQGHQGPFAAFLGGCVGRGALFPWVSAVFLVFCPLPLGQIRTPEINPRKPIDFLDVLGFPGGDFCRGPFLLISFVISFVISLGLRPCLNRVLSRPNLGSSDTDCFFRFGPAALDLFPPCLSSGQDTLGGFSTELGVSHPCLPRISRPGCL